MATTKLQHITPEDLVHQYLTAHSQASGISLSKLLANEAFRASVESIITQLSTCHSEIIEQGIEQEEALFLYRAER